MPALVTPSGFATPSATYPASATISGTSDPNNWESFFTTATLTVPITFSFEPWKYDELCIRLTALPGINVWGFLGQEYDSRGLELNVKDKEAGKRLNPFAFDTRLALMYGSHFGIYAQLAFCKLFDYGYYPFKFGIIISLGGR